MKLELISFDRKKGVKSLWQGFERLSSCQGSLIVAIPAASAVCWYYIESHRTHSYKGNCYTAWMLYIFLNVLLLQQSSAVLNGRYRCVVYAYLLITKCMYLKSVGIRYSCMTAHWSKIKTRFAFFDEVLHQTALTIKPDEVFWRWIHVCDNKCIHVSHLFFRFLYLTDNTSFIRSRCCTIHEFAINYSIINFVISGDIIKLTNQICSFFTEIVILLKPDDVTSSIFFTLPVKFWCSEPTVTTKQKVYGWVICQIFIQDRLKKINHTITWIPGSVS